MTATITEFPQSQPAHSQLDIKQRSRLATRITLISASMMGISSIIFLLTSLNYHYWQLYIITISFGVSFLLSVLNAVFQHERNTDRMVLWLAPTVTVPLIILASVIQNVSLLVALICFLFGTILSTGTLQGSNRDWGISLSFFSALLTSLVGAFSPVVQVRIPLLEIYIPSILCILLMSYVVLLLMEYVSATLRIKLLTGALAIAIIPLIVLSLIDSRFIQNSLQNQSNQALRLAAIETATAMDTFLDTNLDLVRKEATLSVFTDYLNLAPNERKGSPQEKAVQFTLQSLVSMHQSYLRSFGILNMQGIVVYDINAREIGKDNRFADYYALTVSTSQPQISSIYFPENSEDGYLYFSSPIHDSRQKLIGVLRLQFDALVLQDILEEKVNLVGARSHPILLDENHLRIADTLQPNNIYRLTNALPSTNLSQLIRSKRLPDIPIYQLNTGDEELSPFLENYLTNPFFSFEFHKEQANHLESGVVTRLSTKPWYLLFVKEQTSLSTLVQSQNKLSTLISTVIAGIVGLFAIMISGVFSKPIVRLQSTAEQIISGDLNAQVQIESGDEIGSLAGAFNNMTHQLKTLINDLEDRVRDRTKELAAQNQALLFKGRQLTTVSDVARGILSTREFEGLLTQVTSLVSERFNFYHVGVFLIDPKNEYAILRAANSEGGQRMLARQHRLKVGAVGIVGHVTATGEPRIATDVGQDAVYFNNPDLPLTRSEMALPLKSNQKIIGALDVQSTVPNAFTDEDIELFTMLADQISIAIINNQLFNETVRALEESQRIHQQYLHREWTSDISSRETLGFRYTVQGINPHLETQSPEVKLAMESGKPVVKEADSDEQSAVLAIPIQLRGKTLGVIHLKDSANPNRKWNNDEIQSISTVADQVGLALENARLLEQTMRRAERDRKALEITGKIRSTSDPKSMVEVALQELQKTLKASRAQIILKDNGSADKTSEQEISLVNNNPDEGVPV